MQHLLHCLVLPNATPSRAARSLREPKQRTKAKNQNRIRQSKQQGKRQGKQQGMQQGMQEGKRQGAPWLREGAQYSWAMQEGKKQGTCDEEPLFVQAEPSSYKIRVTFVHVQNDLRSLPHAPHATCHMPHATTCSHMRRDTTAFSRDTARAASSRHTALCCLPLFTVCLWHGQRQTLCARRHDTQRARRKEGHQGKKG